MGEPALEIPPVSGRHRNRALAAARRHRCLQLATEGRTYEETARELGYKSRSTPWRHVQGALRAHELEGVTDLREQAFERLEGLRRAVWERATAGNIPSGRQAARIIMNQAQLLGLLDPLAQKCPPSTNCGPATVVIRDDDCRIKGCSEHGVL